MKLAIQYENTKAAVQRLCGVRDQAEGVLKWLDNLNIAVADAEKEGSTDAAA